MGVTGAARLYSTLLTDGLATLASGFVSQASSTVVGQLAVGFLTSSSSAATSTLTGGLVVDTASLVVDYSTGKVGIGTTEPRTLLTLNGASPTLTFVDTGQTEPAGYFQVRSDSNKFQFFSGRLGASANQRMEFGGNGVNTVISNSLSIQTTSGGVFTGTPLINLPTSGVGYFNNGSNFGIGTTSPTAATLSVHGGIYSNATTSTGALVTASTTIMKGNVNMTGLGTLSSGNPLCIATNGQVFDAGTDTCPAPSSLRFKENVQDLSYGLAEILKLRPVSFDYKSQVNIEGPQLGFIAEEVDEVIPEIVKKDAEGNPTGMSATKLISPLTKAVQELWGMIQKLTARVSGLEKKLTEQQKQIDALEARLEKLEQQ